MLFSGQEADGVKKRVDQIIETVETEKSAYVVFAGSEVTGLQGGEKVEIRASRDHLDQSTLSTSLFHLLSAELVA